MAGVGNGGSPSPKVSLESSPSEIKLFLGSDSQKVRVKKADLESLSPVFQKLLSHDMKERNLGQVKLPLVSMKVWTIISAFYFSGEDLVCKDNVKEVVAAVDMFVLTELKDHCDAYLCQNADCTENLLEALNWVSLYTIAKVKRKILNAVRKDFVNICESESFLTLKRDVLLEILCGQYVVSDEHTVCKAVVRWLEANNGDPQTTKQLFQHLKLNEVCLRCLEEHVAGCDNATVRDVVLGLVETEKKTGKRLQCRLPVQYFLLSDINRSNSSPYLFPNKAGQPFGLSCSCKCLMKHDLIFIGRDKTCCCFEMVGALSVKGRWTTMATFPDDGFTPNAACIFANRLVLAGICPQGWRCYFYDLWMKKKEAVPPLQETRTYYGLVSMGDAMHAVMILGENEPLSSIETYSLDGKGWRFSGQMQQAAWSVSATTTGNIIIAHGVTQTNQTVVQCFNTETTSAIVLESAPKAIHFSYAVSFGSEVEIFVRKDETVKVCVSKGEKLSISNTRLPNECL